MKTSDDVLNLAVVGGGAAGYFAALRAGALKPGARITIFESNRRPLEKVRISGGGRCNVTHNCFEPALLMQSYPRGAKELRSAFHRFQPRDMLSWLAERGVELKAEEDGRMFPTTDDSSTIIKCFEDERRASGIGLVTGCRVTAIFREADSFILECREKNSEKKVLRAENVLLATGSHPSGHSFARVMGHSITVLAPSLFTLNVHDRALQNLSGVAARDVSVTLLLDNKKCTSTRGPLLVTHWGVSGPVILKLSAWAARELQERGYKGSLIINWTGDLNTEQARCWIAKAQADAPRREVRSTPQFSLPARLWEFLLNSKAPHHRERPWSQIGKAGVMELAALLTAYSLDFDGKGQFKEEFVTCGGVDLSGVDFRSMQSRHVPGLFLAGEILDIDGLTGGFNFQSAWTCGWIAGSAAAQRFSGSPAA